MPFDPIITLQNVSKKYDTETLSGVSDISLSINKGDILAIVGESGSGKSTLLKLIYGLLAPDAGSVFFNDVKVPGPHEKLIPGHDRMKMVSQDFSLNIYAKVYDNIAAMLPSTNIAYKQQKTKEIMQLLRIDHLANKKAVDLSGGEQQRVAIARAIITEPEVLLMDEPFSQIDALLKTQLREDVRHLSKELGITIILVTHDPADGLSLADELVVLQRGNLVEHGPSEKLYQNPHSLYTAQLLANCNILTSAEALLLGIKSYKNQVVIYPEWAEINKNWSSHKFDIVSTSFKGFYSELVLERNGVRLRLLNIQSEAYKAGMHVSVSIKKHLEFE